ncbi:MAG: hypothetical protein JXX28_20030 [Deltaproteobacteria bacterium]|nr:hypothetical protein [Deltaproteobacteria bacterium]
MELEKERLKRVARVHALRDRIAEWAARDRPAELRAGIRRYLGPQEPDESLVMQGVAFALIAPPPGGTSPIDRYREAAGKLSRADRAVLAAWGDAWFSVCVILAVDPGVGLRLEDVVTGRQVDVLERSASHQVLAGEWLACFLMPVQGGIELEGTSILLEDSTRLPAVQAYLRELRERGLDPAEVPAATSRAFAWAVIQAVHDIQRTPNYQNFDGHPIEIITATLTATWSEVRRATASWEDAVEDQGTVDLMGRHEPTLNGPLVLATFHHEGGQRVTLSVNSRQRLAQVLSLWETRVGSPLGTAEEVVRPTESDPAGPVLLMDSSLQGAESIERAGADFWANWLDLPLGGLDGLTPRQAVSAGRVAEVRALLPTDQWQQMSRSLRDGLDL